MSIMYHLCWCWLHQSAAQYSLLMPLCEMSEVFNHNGDHIAEEIIILLPAEAVAFQFTSILSV